MWRLELLFPRTRVIRRLEDGLVVYGVFGLQGETYAVRSADMNDLMQYRDVRLGLGATLLTREPITEDGWRWHILADRDGNEFCVLQPPA